MEYNIGIPKGIPIFVLLLGDKSIKYTKDRRDFYMKKNWGKALAIALILCLVGAFGASVIQSDFGRVEITDVVIRTDAGEYTGYLFVPENATPENPAPAIVTSHGYLNNREMQDLNYVELARRG